MAGEYVVHERGSNLSLPVPTDHGEKLPVKIGSLNGFTLTGEGEGGNIDGEATVKLEGVVRIMVTGTVAAVGDPVYITTGHAVNVTNTNQLYGHALETKGATAALCNVRITN